MKFEDLLIETYSALVSNKVRTSLTMLGIVIGIASVIAMVSIGQGAQQTIESNIQSLGSNLIQVLPGSQGGGAGQVSQGRGSAKTLTSEDAQMLEGLIGIKALAPELSGRYQVVGKGANTNTQVVGTTPEYPEVRNLNLAEGSFFSTQHLKSLSKVAIIGPNVRDDLFGEGALALGQVIRINGIQFKIIGVTQSKGGGSFGSQDDMVFIPLTSAQKFLAGSTYVSNISIEAESTDVMTQVQEEVTNALLERHHIKDPTKADFSILNQNDIVATASSVTGTFTILLGAVAGISLLVGGIGIMNMMLTTVTERTREIGLRKAIGAQSQDISRQFLIESVALTVIGGVIGIILGGGASWIISSLGVIQTSVSVFSIALSCGVSIAIGLAFGYYPAKRASNLSPIKALRYE